mgnify:FL=1
MDAIELTDSRNQQHLHTRFPRALLASQLIILILSASGHFFIVKGQISSSGQSIFGSLVWYYSLASMYA